MARQNNTSRSLIIMSKLQGWDPTKIDGKDFVGNVYPEDRTMKGDTPYLTGPLPKDPQEPCPDPSAPGPDARTPGNASRSHGNPYGPGKSEAGA